MRGGSRVRALARSDGSAAAVEALGAEPVRGDLDDVEAMARGAEGCDTAFHLAAHLGTWGTREEFERGNVVGTENALEAAAPAGVRRFVHCGTEAALIAGEPLVNVDETAPLRPDSKALYSATKAQAEQAVRDASGGRLRDGRRAAALRLGRGRHHAAARDRGDGRAGPLRLDRRRRGTSPRSRTSTTWSRASCSAAEKGAPGEAYFVTDGEPVVFREFVSEMLETQGVEAPNRSMPAPAGAARRPRPETAWRALPLTASRRSPASPSGSRRRSARSTSRRRARELGYAPVVSREEGLAELREAAA